MYCIACHCGYVMPHSPMCIGRVSQRYKTTYHSLQTHDMMIISYYPWYSSFTHQLHSVYHMSRAGFFNYRIQLQIFANLRDHRLLCTSWGRSELVGGISNVMCVLLSDTGNWLCFLHVLTQLDKASRQHTCFILVTLSSSTLLYLFCTL